MSRHLTARKRLVGRGWNGFGCRPVNDWGGGALPAPWAVGDLVDVGADARALGRRYLPGLHVVSDVSSIDEGDAWCVRLRRLDGAHVGSERLHVAGQRTVSWPHGPVDWMDGSVLVDSADPDGLERRRRMLSAAARGVAAADEKEATK